MWPYGAGGFRPGGFGPGMPQPTTTVVEVRPSSQGSCSHSPVMMAPTHPYGPLLPVTVMVPSPYNNRHTCPPSPLSRHSSPHSSRHSPTPQAGMTIVQPGIIGAPATGPMFQVHPTVPTTAGHMESHRCRHGRSRSGSPASDRSCSRSR